ncbi:uncharacterized protein HMPREF1541_09287 [Cyphellophora europaea CBS 101466]|uniref:Zn(2)-C6 fungal-type domain-containing protein n=1 Tax=Cyphellophora europaea (strain CBS 101466) TaxID=1220924 RepID=W2S9R0_CYPE1|nr:uncharacterized protein HMPREF1541_09287 [Cyphellophora europaea CBS 101466]ETN45456.1 hypothetical protein HMPREF1541_09287 [Cyphellophora europaea CBS 101466]
MPPARKDLNKSIAKRVGKRQAYHLTCHNCRTRKVKCDGAQPECGICKAYSQQCQYDKAPPMSQVLAMAERIAQLEKGLDIQREDNQQHDVSDGASVVMEVPSPTASRTTAYRSPVDTVTSASQETPHYPSTSAVEDPVTGQNEENSTRSPSLTAVMPTMNEEQLQYWEKSAVQACATQLRLPEERIEHLLKTHWTWVLPMFLFSNRVQFVRDAASGGLHASELLLCVICLHSTRFTDHALSEELFARVRLLLGQELHQKPKIPTVQALLQLSAREMGKGSISQAWLYSGMAFRMAVDMGIFTKTKGQPSDLELDRVHQQLAWSCYTWDKIVSLYLGRVPTLPEVPNFPPPVVDEITEKSIWIPYGAETLSAWQPMFSYTYSAFENFCKLVVIIHDILITVYAKNRPQQITYFVNQTRQRLEEWHKDTPPHLKAGSVPDQCPPPHILTQIMLYYTTLILLHRPFRSNSQCQTICRDAARQCEELILSFEKSFGLSHVTYLIAYCSYTAATVALQDLHDGIEGSQTRVNTYLRALYSVRAGTPGIQRSIDIIVRNLDRRTPAPKPQTESTNQDLQMPIDALPAFPFDVNCDLMNFTTGDVESLPIGGLDSFAYGFVTTPSDNYANIF